MTKLICHIKHQSIVYILFPTGSNRVYTTYKLILLEFIQFRSVIVIWTRQI